MSVTLKAGDLVYWEDGDKSAPLLVDENGTDLCFQFGLKPWHKMSLQYEDGREDRGLTVEEASQALNLGIYPLAFPGRLYKCYDAESDTSLPDPELDQ